MGDRRSDDREHELSWGQNYHEEYVAEGRANGRGVAEGLTTVPSRGYILPALEEWGSRDRGALDGGASRLDKRRRAGEIESLLSEESVPNPRSLRAISVYHAKDDEFSTGT